MDVDPAASLWIMKPMVGATPLRLARADAPGVTDGRPAVQNSFPKWTPFTFRRTGELGSRLFWFTFSSNRNYGLRAPDAGETLVWVAGVNPDACLRGEDGSFPAFALPFQDVRRDKPHRAVGQALGQAGVAGLARPRRALSRALARGIRRVPALRATRL
jgi:hypothetical protein